MESRTVLASLASKVMGQVEFANHVPISPGRNFSPQLSYSMPLCNIPGKYTETVDFTLQRKFWKLFWQTSQKAHTVFNMYSVFLLLAFMILVYKAWDFYGH